MELETGLLVIRVVIGALLVGHGAQKLFGWFGGYGLEGTAGWLGSIGVRQPKLGALAASLGEFMGGLGLAIGLLTPIAAAVLVGVMLVAAYSHRSAGIWGSNGGYELPLLYLVIAAGIGLAGPGFYSLDGALGISYSISTYLIAQLIVLLGASVPLLQIHLGPEQQRTEQT